MKKKKPQPSPHIQEQCGVWLSAKGRNKLQDGSNDQRLLPGWVRQSRVVLGDVSIPQPRRVISGKQSSLSMFFKCSDRPAINKGPLPPAEKLKIKSNTIQTTLDDLPGTSSLPGASSKGHNKENLYTPGEIVSESTSYSVSESVSKLADEEPLGNDCIPLQDITTRRLKRKGHFEEAPMKRLHFCKDISEGNSSSITYADREDSELMQCPDTLFHNRMQYSQRNSSDMTIYPLCADGGKEASTKRYIDCDKSLDETEEFSPSILRDTLVEVHSAADAMSRSVCQKVGQDDLGIGSHGKRKCFPSVSIPSTGHNNSLGSDDKSLSEFEEFTPSILRDSLMDSNSILDRKSLTTGRDKHKVSQSCKITCSLYSETSTRPLDPDDSLSEFDEFTPSMLRDTLIDLNSVSDHSSGKQQKVCEPHRTRSRVLPPNVANESTAEPDTAGALSEFDEFTPSILRDASIDLNSVSDHNLTTTGQDKASKEFESTGKMKPVRPETETHTRRSDHSCSSEFDEFTPSIMKDTLFD